MLAYAKPSSDALRRWRVLALLCVILIVVLTSVLYSCDGDGPTPNTPAWALVEN